MTVSGKGGTMTDGTQETTRATPEERRGDRRRFEQIAPDDLAAVLRRYDLGSVTNMTPFTRGSTRAPKLRLATDAGEFLLKCRAPGQDDPEAVAFTHGVQIHLQNHAFPTAGLIGTVPDKQSMVVHNDRTYEMFHFVEGDRYDGTEAGAVQAGMMLATLHRLLVDHRDSYDPPSLGYHMVPGFDRSVQGMPAKIHAAEPDTDEATISSTCEQLRKAYHVASGRVEAEGFAGWPLGLIHGDWHPGNLMFYAGQVTAVIDFDAVRLGPRMIDIANAALQFSMRRGGVDDLDQWPDDFRLEAIKGIVRGYLLCADPVLTRKELAAMPWLMIEATILESVATVAKTGTFAGIPGSSFLAMVQRKVVWLHDHAAEIPGLGGDAA